MISTIALNKILEILTQLGENNMANITPINTELTIQEGADMLNISRLAFINLLNAKKIPFICEDNRRKVYFKDINEYKERIKQLRIISLEELSALDQEMDMGY